MTCWLCGFETTELATDAKAPTCENAPCQICIAVTKVDKEIDQAVATLQRLLAKRCDLRSEQNRVHGLMHRLPVELKNSISELLLPPRDESGRTERNVKTPSYFASICRSWRDIAWSNPLLWSTMHIALGTHISTSDSSSRIDFVQDWILRSRTMPLTLHIVIRDRDEGLQRLIDAISRCSNRWHSLSLNIPLKLLRAFHSSNSHYHVLKRLRIIAGDGSGDDINEPVPLLDPTVSPEQIEICGVPFQWLQISWNHLSSAKVGHCGLDDLMQLFQHASQMTYCHIFVPLDRDQVISVPLIIHHGLKTLSLRYTRNWDAVDIFLGSLTLPCLQEFHVNEMFLLGYLPALVHRSSCPLTRITFVSAMGSISDWDVFGDLQPLPGVTDLVFENVETAHQTATAASNVKKLLLEEYFPDLCCITLGEDHFLFLLDQGVIPLLLDRKPPRHGAGNRGRLRSIRVKCQSDMLDYVVEEVGEQLKAKQSSINLTEDGFEILITEA
jgi:hypothetical protein